MTQAVSFLNQFGSGLGGITTNLGDVQTAAAQAVVNGVAFLVEAFSEVVRVGAAVLRTVGSLVTVIPTLGQVTRVVGRTFILFFQALETGFNTIRTAVSGLVAGIVSVGATFGVFSAEQEAAAFQALSDSFDATAEAAERTNRTLGELGDAFADIATNGANVEELAGFLEGLGDAGERAAAALREAAEAGDFSLAEDGPISTATGGGAGGETGEAVLGSLVENFEEQLSRLEILNPERAAALSRRFSTALAAGLDSGEINTALREFSEEAGDAIREELGPTLGQELESAVVQNFGATLRGEGIAFTDLFANVLEERAFRSLESAFARALDGFAEAFDGVLSQAGGRLGELFGAEGQLGGLLSGALSLGGSLVTRALADNESNITSNLVRSTGVESVEPQRGVVAGQTQFNVRDVQEGFEVALEGTNDLLALLLAAVRANGGAGGLPAATNLAASTTTATF